MEDSHINNALRMMIRNNRSSEGFRILQEELIVREILAKEKAISEETRRRIIL